MNKIAILFLALFLFFITNCYGLDELTGKAETNEWYNKAHTVFLGGTITCIKRDMMEHIYNAMLQKDHITINNEDDCTLHDRPYMVIPIQTVDDGKLTEIYYAEPIETYPIYHGWTLTQYLHSKAEIEKEIIH